MDKKSGSYTVEASLLYPFVIMIIIGIICTCFVMHDRGIAYAGISEAIEKEASCIISDISSEDADVSEITDNIADECNKNMFVSYMENISYSCKSDHITISAEIKTDIPFYKQKIIKLKQYAATYTDKVRAQFLVN